MVSQWDADKGYGFITVAATSERLFAHARAFAACGRPYGRGGELRDRAGRPRQAPGAEGARHGAACSPARAWGQVSGRRDSSRICCPIPLFAAWVLATELVQGSAALAVGRLLTMSLATFIVYWATSAPPARQLACGRGRAACAGAVRRLARRAARARVAAAQERQSRASATGSGATVLLNVLAFAALFTPWLKS